MKDNWNEINLILQEKRNKWSPNEISKEDYAKIAFLLREINQFPDNQKTVTETGSNFRDFF